MKIHDTQTGLRAIPGKYLTLLEGAASADETQSESVTTSASAAVIIDMETGRVLLSYHENEPLPMASTTKVMTALLALENGNLDDVVTVSQNAYGVPWASISAGAICFTGCCWPAAMMRLWPLPSTSAATWKPFAA